MARALGYFSATERGFEGTIATLTAKAAVDIVTNEQKETDRHPAYRIYAKTGLEIGGIWIAHNKTTGEEYLSATLSNPAFGDKEIYANLAPVKGEDGKFVLLWNAK